MAHHRRKKPRSLILSGNGINCELETAHANRLAGFDAEIVHINTLMEGAKNIHDYDFLNLPGGFLDGDDLGAGKAQAVKWRYQRIKDSENRFVDEFTSSPWMESSSSVFAMGFSCSQRQACSPASKETMDGSG